MFVFSLHFSLFSRWKEDSNEYCLVHKIRTDAIKREVETLIGRMRIGNNNDVHSLKIISALVSGDLLHSMKRACNAFPKTQAAGCSIIQIV